MVQACEIIERIEQYAPLKYRESNDPTGFQIGNPYQEVHRVMVTLDVRPEVVQEAVGQHVDFIFAHHPVMFRPAKNLDLTNPQNAMYAAILKNNITVYAAHTNLDKTKGGMNDWLSEKLGLQNVQGFISDADNPDVYLGRYGEIPNPMAVRDYAQEVRRIFDVPGLRLISHQLDKVVKTVAVIGGDGGKFYPAVVAKQIDVFVTGDVYYHTGHDMIAAGISVIDPGHHIESIVKPQMTSLLKKWSQENDWDIEVFPSTLNTDPFTFINK